MKLNRLVAWLLAAALILGLCPQPAQAAHRPEANEAAHHAGAGTAAVTPGVVVCPQDDDAEDPEPEPEEPVCPHENTGWEQFGYGCGEVCYDCGAIITNEMPHDMQFVDEDYLDEQEEDYELYGCMGCRIRAVTCTRCHIDAMEDIQPLGHNYVDGFCTRCGEEMTQECAEGNHSWSWLGETYPNNCADDPGARTEYCMVCGVTRVIPLYNVQHEYVDDVCTICGLTRPPVTTDVLFEMTPEDGRDKIAYGDSLEMIALLTDLNGEMSGVDASWYYAPVTWWIQNEEGERRERQMSFNLWEEETRGGLYSYFQDPALPAGSYTFCSEVYRYVDGVPVEIAYAEYPITYDGWNGATPQAIEIRLDDADELAMGANSTVYAVITLTGENGLPVQNATVYAELYQGETKVDDQTDWMSTDGSGIAYYSKWINPNEYGDGTYTLVAYSDDDPTVRTSLDFTYEARREPVIYVSTDKASYDFGNRITLNVEIANEEGNTEGLAWILSSYISSISVEFPNGECYWDYPDVTVPGYSFSLTPYANFLLLGEGDPDYNGECTVSLYIDSCYSGSAVFWFTGEKHPCEGEHEWGDWQGDGYDDETDQIVHVRYCNQCGMKESEPCTPGELQEVSINETECYMRATVCTVCGQILDVLEEVHPSQDFSDHHEYNAPSCLDSGFSNDYTECNVCGLCVESRSRSLAPLGHDFVDGVCTRCGVLQSDLPEDCGHDWWDCFDEPVDCAHNPGSIVRVCSICGAREESPLYNVLHRYEDGVCTLCGQVRPAESTQVCLQLDADGQDTLAYGDIINVMEILRSCSGSQEEIDEGWKYLFVALWIQNADGERIMEESSRQEWWYYESNRNIWIDKKTIPAGDYTFCVEAYRYEDGAVADMVYAEYPFHYTGYNGAKAHEISVALESADAEPEWGWTYVKVAVELRSEDGLPVQGEEVRLELLRDGETVPGCNGTIKTDGMGLAYWSFGFQVGEQEEGLYTIRASVRNQPEIFTTMEYNYTAPQEPVIQVSTDKDSYDYGNQIVLTVNITNSSGTTDGLDWFLGKDLRYVEVEFPDGSVRAHFPDMLISAFSFTYVVDEPGFLSLDAEQDPGVVGQCRLTVGISWNYYATTQFQYTGETHFCEGEHVWGDWVPNGADMQDHYHHARYCTLCGFCEEADCEGGEEQKVFIGKSECYYVTSFCTVCAQELAWTAVVHPHENYYVETYREEPSCTETGIWNEAQYCRDCGSWIDSETEILPALGHDFVDNVCTRCGAVNGIQVTIDGDTFDFLDVVPVNAFVIGVEETEENLESRIYAEMIDSNGKHVDGFYIQSTKGLSMNPHFPLGNEEMKEGVYRIVVTKTIGEVLYTGEASFTYTGYREIEDDWSAYRVELTVTPEHAQFGERINLHARVIDADGNPVNRVKVVFSFVDTNGVYDLGYHITFGEGTCEFGISFTQDELPFESGFARVIIVGTEVFATALLTVGEAQAAYELDAEEENLQIPEGSEEDLTLRIVRSAENDTCLDHFKGAALDGVLMAQGTDYTATSGSVILTLKAEFLATLSAGEHVLAVLFDDGVVEVPLQVEAAVEPEGFAVQVTDLTKAAATASLEPDRLYRGETRFTLDCETACVVAVRTADGYVELACVMEDGVPTFTLSVEADTELVIVLRGDTNLDGSVGTKDATFVRKIVAQVAGIETQLPDLELSKLAGDANADGSIGTKDATAIRKVVAQVAGFTLPWKN